MPHRLAKTKPARRMMKKKKIRYKCPTGMKPDPNYPESGVMCIPDTGSIVAASQSGVGRYAPGSVYASMQPMASAQRNYGYTRGLTRTETYSEAQLEAMRHGREYGRNIESHATGRGYFEALMPAMTRKRKKARRRLVYEITDGTLEPRSKCRPGWNEETGEILGKKFTFCRNPRALRG